MITPRASTALVGLLLFSLGPVLTAQVEHGGLPPSLRRALRLPVPTARMRPVDRMALLAEDAARGGRGPLRFADVLEVELGPENAGVWEDLGDGDRVWRLRLLSEGAYSIALVFSRFQLPEGAELFVYDDARETVRGAYTELENRLDGEFAIQPTPGQALTLEYFEPRRARGRSGLVLALVVHDYVDILGQKGGGGGAGACEVDVACPEGAAWPDQIAAVAQVLVLPTGLCCSGSLVNNTANDGTALFISAAHCGSLTNAVFTFNYQRPMCGSGTAPTTDKVVGSVELVSDATLDFRLVRLVQPIPASFGVFQPGWDRTDSPPTNTATIHHPGGDVKKISLDNNAPSKQQSFWQIKQWDVGVTEGGSSGSPLYSPQGHFIGQLSAGASSCLFPDGDDFYGRLDRQWSLVEPFLDPALTRQMTLDGLDPSTVTPAPLDVTGVFPTVIETLYPGTQKVMRILGSGFTDTATVSVDGVGLSPTSSLRGGNSVFLIDPPQLDIGQHTVTVTDGSVSDSVVFNVVAPAQPRYQAVNGEPGDPIISSSGVDLYFADQPGHVHYWFWSLSNVPSIHPLFTLALGNNFTELRRCGSVTIPAQGWVRVHVSLRTGAFPRDTTLYSQTLCVTHGLPAPSSGLQESIFLF